MSSVRLSILISMYNEANSIKAVLDRVVTAPAAFFHAKEVVADLIIVDNGSQDKSSEVVEEFASSHPEVSLRLIRYPENVGKGAAIRHAIAQAQSDFCIIQDADLEYDPIDYPKLLKPLLAGEADVVLGSRLLNDVERRPLGFWQAVANRIITTVTGMAAGLALSDVETGFKAFRTSLAQSVPLRSDRFGLDPELIVRFAKRRARFVEVPISYRGQHLRRRKKDSCVGCLGCLRQRLPRLVLRCNPQRRTHGHAGGHVGSKAFQPLDGGDDCPLGKRRRAGSGRGHRTI